MPLSPPARPPSSCPSSGSRFNDTSSDAAPRPCLLPPPPSPAAASPTTTKSPTETPTIAIAASVPSTIATGIAAAVPVASCTPSRPYRPRRRLPPAAPSPRPSPRTLQPPQLVRQTCPRVARTGALQTRTWGSRQHCHVQVGTRLPLWRSPSDSPLQSPASESACLPRPLSYCSRSASDSMRAVARSQFISTLCPRSGACLCVALSHYRLVRRHLLVWLSFARLWLST